MEGRAREQEWRDAVLYFDGGARGDPGPGGSGWALLVRHPAGEQLELHSFGYKYQGSTQTNNFCEYEVLREGLALAWREFGSTATRLEVRGDSNMIIEQQSGRSRTRSAALQESAWRVRTITENFKATNWKHVRRVFNTAADFLANEAMDSKGAETAIATSQNQHNKKLSKIKKLLQADLKESGLPPRRSDLSTAITFIGTS